jgi:hypothetical protein
LQTFIVTLGMPGEWERLEYESDTRPKVGEAILLSDGRWASVDDIVPTAEGSSLLECQRLYRLLLIDMDANPVEPGEMLSGHLDFVVEMLRQRPKIVGAWIPGLRLCHRASRGTVRQSQRRRNPQRRARSPERGAVRRCYRSGLTTLFVLAFSSVVIATGCGGNDTEGTAVGTTGATTDNLPEWVAKVPLRGIEISPPGAWDGAITEQKAIAAARDRFYPGEQPPQRPTAIPVRVSGTVVLSVSIDEAGNEHTQERALDRSPAWLVLFAGIEKHYLDPPGVAEDENSAVLTDVVVLVDGQTGERLENLALFGDSRLTPD